MSRTTARIATAGTLVGLLVAGLALVFAVTDQSERVHLTAHFANTTGLYPGDQVRILGVPVGEVDTITPGPDGATVTMWFDGKYDVPADAEAVILSPGLVSARVVQLTPAYTGGAVMGSDAVIPRDRTAVPVEYDDLRIQLEKLNESLQPAQPGGVAPAGAMINSAADNLRGQGADVREALTQLSQALSALGDHSGDIAGTVKNLSVLVSALKSSADVLKQLNGNLASVTGLLAQNPGAVGAMVRDLDTAVAEVSDFVADNRESLGTTFDKLSSMTTMLNEKLPELKQVLHVSPTTMSNFANIYRPASSGMAGTFAISNFANPLQFMCSSIQAASRLNYEQAAKLCVQYMAPIFKNREYNFPPVGTMTGLLSGLPVVGAMARPNEITYSEDRLRPDYRPTPTTDPAAAPLAAEMLVPDALQTTDIPTAATNPDDGLAGLMTPPGGN